MYFFTFFSKKVLLTRLNRVTIFMNLNEGGKQMVKITLKAARVTRGLSQKEAAEKLGISESTLYKWESGKNKPNAKYLPKIEKVFGIQISNIIF